MYPPLYVTRHSLSKCLLVKLNLKFKIWIFGLKYFLEFYYILSSTYNIIKLSAISIYFLPKISNDFTSEEYFIFSFTYFQLLSNQIALIIVIFSDCKKIIETKILYCVDQNKTPWQLIDDKDRYKLFQECRINNSIKKGKLEIYMWKITILEIVLQLAISRLLFLFFQSWWFNILFDDGFSLSPPTVISHGLYVTFRHLIIP